MFQLHTATPPRWLEVVLGDFDTFVVDHALCERKASALGMSLVAKYPDRPLILEPLIAFAREELEHFHIMFKLLSARGLRLVADEPDSYVNGLRKAMRSEPEALLLDRLLVSGVVEARGCERLQMVAAGLSEPALKATYLELTRAEARHHALFFRLAQAYFPVEQVRQRADELFEIEAGIIAQLPLRAAVH